MDDDYTAPSSDAELFDQYYDEVKRLVYKLGHIHPDDVADITNDILLRFWERSMREEYDPELEFEVDGVKRPATFRTFLHGFVRLYMRGIKKRYRVKTKREPVICDKPIFAGQVPWIEVFGPVQPEDHSDIEAVSLVHSIRGYLETVPKRSKQDICDLPRLFDLVVMQIWNDGKVSVPQLMKEFGVSNTAIHSWIRRLREQVAIALGGLGYEKGLGYWDGLGYERTERGWAHV